MDTEHERLDNGAPMLGPNGGMLFETSIVDDQAHDLRWGGPMIEALSYAAAEERAKSWSHDRIAGFVWACGEIGKPFEPCLRLIERIEGTGRSFRLRVDGILYGTIPA